MTAGIACAMLVNDRSGCKAGRGRGARGIRGVMGRLDKADGTSAVTGGRCAHTGRPKPVALADQDAGPGRDAAALAPRRQRLRTGPGRARARPARP